MRKAVALLLALLMLVSPALAATVVVPGLPPVVVPDSPYSGAVLHLPMDEGTGNVTYNAVNPTLNNGTLVDGNSTNTDGVTLPTWVPGKLGYALQFDGEDDYVVISDFSASDPQNAITVTMWANPAEGTTLLNRRSGNLGSISTGWVHWAIGYGSDTKFYFHLTTWDGTSSGGKRTISSQPHQPNNWYFIAMSYDSTTGEFKGYINGKLEASLVIPAGERIIYYDYNDPNAGGIDRRLFIGDFDGSYRAPGKKTIDEVMIFNRALSDEEIQLLYQRGASHRFDTNISINLRQISVPRLDLGRGSAAVEVSFDVSADATNVWIPVPAAATDLSTTSFAYGIDGKVLTIDDNRYVNASSVSFKIPIRIDSATESELPGELYLDSDSKTFEFRKSVRIYNPSDISIMATLSIDPSAIGIANAYLDGSPMSLYNGSLISSVMLSPSESKVMELTASLPVSKQEIEFRSTLDDFLEIDSFDEAYRMAQSVAEGKIDTMTRVIAIETLDFRSFGNRSVVIPLDVKAKDIIEARTLTGSKELLEIREGKDGRAEIVVPATAFNGTAFDMHHAEVKVIYNKKPAWWEGIPFLKSLSGFFEFLKKLFGGG